MGNPTSRRLNEDQRRELWRMWRAGKSHQDIARHMNISKPSVFLYIEKRGGIEPRERKRSAIVLRQDEREEISRGLRAGMSLRQIARELDRSPSTISREVRRHGGREKYRAASADRRAWQHARRPKPSRLAGNEALRTLVSEKLRLEWSPEQIALWLERENPDDPSLQVSHETIYKSLFIQSRGALNRALRDHLRTKRRFRQSRHKTRKGHGPIPDPISIRERPAEVEDRAIPGHWEGDLIAGEANLSYIATLVERKTRFVMLVRVRSKETREVTRAISRQIGKLPVELRKTLTWDNGSELAGHKELKLASKLDIYFCDPYSPWQRGSNENTNGLLRQYFPKGTDLSGYTQAQLDKVAARLNGRPRKTLGVRTPAEALQQAFDEAGVASTG